MTHIRAYARLIFSMFCLYVAGCLALIFAIGLIVLHVREIESMRSSALPLLETLPALEQRLSILREQVEVAELNAAVRTGSDAERVRIFTLPTQTSLDRALALFDAFRRDLEGRGVLSSLSPIKVGEKIERKDGLRAVPLTMTFAVRSEGARDVFAFLKFAGLLTVGDTLTRAEKSALIRATEQENPAAIVSLEQFFSTDLLSYAKEPRTFEEQLKRSLSSDSFDSTLETVLGESLLKNAKDLLAGELGKSIDRYRLWPMQLMQVASSEVRPGAAPDWYEIKVTVLLLERKS